MEKRVRHVTIRFMLAQPEDAIRTWTDPELSKVLSDCVKTGASTVDGELVPYSLYINISKPERAPD